MVDPWKDLYSTLLAMKWLMVDPWKDLSWIFFLMKKLKLNQWKNISSTLTRKHDCVIIIKIGPLTRLLKYFHKSRPRPEQLYGNSNGTFFWSSHVVLYNSFTAFFTCLALNCNPTIPRICIRKIGTPQIWALNSIKFKKKWSWKIKSLPDLGLRAFQRWTKTFQV